MPLDNNSKLKLKFTFIKSFVCFFLLPVDKTQMSKRKAKTMRIITIIGILADGFAK